jgi:hypothetical protein
MSQQGTKMLGDLPFVVAEIPDRFASESLHCALQEPSDKIECLPGLLYYLWPRFRCGNLCDEGIKGRGRRLRDLIGNHERFIAQGRLIASHWHCPGKGKGVLQSFDTTPCSACEG